MISSNLDIPEGGMDAVMQAILCEDVCAYVCSVRVHTMVKWNLYT